MDTPQTGHIVTVTDVFHKLEMLEPKVDLLLERDIRDTEVIKQHNKDITSLKVFVYAGALPLTLISSVVLGFNWISGLF